MALEVRRQKIGFVVVEGKAGLLDWGIRSCKSRDSIEGAVTKKIKPVLDLYSPAIIVIKQPGARAADRNPTVIAFTRAIGFEGKRRSIKTQFLPRSRVTGFFAAYGCTSKYDTASFLATQFDELAWKLPPKRKIWQSERHNMLIFDAAATAMAFLGRLNREAATK